MKTTQWGLPTETQVTVKKRFPTSRGTATTSRSGPFMGISGARNVACPISTVTWSTRSPARWHTASTTPPFVSIRIGDFRRPPRSQRYFAKIRRPFPDFSASLPSGLKMRSPTSATPDVVRSRIPSEPTPQLRWQIHRTAGGPSGKSRSRSSMTR